MKCVLLLCFFAIVSCNDKSHSSPEATSTPEVNSNSNTTLDYIFDEGVTHVLERKLEGYELKAAIVNSFHSLLFYYNEDLQIVCCYVEEILTVNDRENMITQLNGQDMRPNLRYLIDQHDPDRDLILVDLDKIAQDEYDDLLAKSIPIGFGFKLEPTDTFEFSMLLAGDSLNQKVEITYSPNNGWSSSASSFIHDRDPITANIFTFGNEKVFDQLKRLPKNDKECIIRRKPLPHYGYTLKLSIDSDYDDFNMYSYEIEVIGKVIVVNGNDIVIDNIQGLIESETKNLHFKTDIRISLSDKSDDQTVRQLFDRIQYLSADYTIGIK